MVEELLARGFAEGKDLNCAETILAAANEAYELGLDREAIKLAGPFGGGMGIESVCGALTGSLMVLGRLLVVDREHASPQVKETARRFLARFEQRMGSIHCDELKRRYRTEERGCRDVIRAAAAVLDEVIREAKGSAR